MANIAAYLAIIQAASRGEDVRDAIVDALEAMNNDIPAEIGDMTTSDYDRNGNVANAGGIEAYIADAIGDAIGGEY